MSLDFDELKEMAETGAEEPLEISVSDISDIAYGQLPEGVSLSVFESYFPETTLWREGDVLVAEISEHIYTKFWEHKYHARVFADAMYRAVRRLMSEGYPFREVAPDGDDDVHIFVRWHLLLPVDTPGTAVVESIGRAFDDVWGRAERILDNSDSVLILGKDTGDGLDRLKRIGSVLDELGYHIYIIKEQPDRIGESVMQKVLRHALSSKFVIVENTEPSGHLYEIPHVTKMAECTTIVLQEEGKGATWMFEDAYVRHSHWGKFTYTPEALDQVVRDAVAWAEDFVRQFGHCQALALPWLTGK
jgi:hypothetical protein